MREFSESFILEKVVENFLAFQNQNFCDGSLVLISVAVAVQKFSSKENPHPSICAMDLSMMLAHHGFLVRARARARKRRRLKALEMAIAAMKTVLVMNSLRTRHYITRSDLLPIRATPWRHLCASHQDMGALQLMGLTWRAFGDLLSVFAPVLEQQWQREFSSPANWRGSGRKRIMNSADILGLTLCWLHVPSYNVMIMLVFGLCPSTLSRYLKRGRRALLTAFKKHPAARIAWPTAEEMQQYSHLISLRQPDLHGVFGFVDGLNLAMFEPPYGALQNAYYNGWLSGCFCSSLFCFAPDGTIIWCTINFPGSWADGELAKRLYSLLETVPPGFFIAADCAFNRADMAGKIIRPLKSDELTRYADSVSVRAFVAHVKRHRLALSIRQGAEWGMGAMQGMCGRLRHRLSSNSAVRRELLELCSHYFNFRTRTVGLNQISTVYHPEHTSTVLQHRMSYYYHLQSSAVY
jgi:hypothetical protein